MLRRFLLLQVFLAMWVVRMRDIKDDYPIKINYKKFGVWFIACVLMAVVTIWTHFEVDLMLTAFAGILFFFGTGR